MKEKLIKKNIFEGITKLIDSLLNPLESVSNITIQITTPTSKSNSEDLEDYFEIFEEDEDKSLKNMLELGLSALGIVPMMDELKTKKNIDKAINSTKLIVKKSK